MNYLLDTDTITFFYDDTRKEHLSVIDKISRLKSDDKINISILSLFELEYSYSNAKDEGIKHKVKSMVEDIKRSSKDKTINLKILPLKEKVAYAYGEIKALLKQNESISRDNIKRHNFDIMLASIALTDNYILVSGDGIYQTIAKYKPDFQFQTWWKRENE